MVIQGVSGKLIHSLKGHNFAHSKAVEDVADGGRTLIRREDLHCPGGSPTVRIAGNCSRRPAEDDGRKSIGNVVGWDVRYRKDATGHRRAQRQNQHRQLPAICLPRPMYWSRWYKTAAPGALPALSANYGQLASEHADSSEMQIPDRKAGGGS
ncbi:unnamed protein product [Heligmosomoides polygyrus]|uniref:Uncharacterized protein n=1 Tax=Heligmosomoides polygyrus TaxID=6339 RepID=A0A183F487_HELPZ|nr:unnamed protein product [Heligmosomoides polygyrus]